jgi:hypothetical protein
MCNELNTPLFRLSRLTCRFRRHPTKARFVRLPRVYVGEGDPIKPRLDQHAAQDPLCRLKNSATVIVTRG